MAAVRWPWHRLATSRSRRRRRLYGVVVVPPSRRRPHGVLAPPSRRRPFRCVAAVALVAVAGCTGGGGASGGPGDAGGTRGGGAAPQGRSGGTLAIALLDPGPLDPARAADLEDEIVLGNLFDGLTGIDPSGGVRPAVAASWSSDPALRRWEFRLRPDARWSDGSPLRAVDFVFAWHRLADPKASAGTAPAARALLSGVTGYHAFAGGRSRSIAGLETPDPTTLVVRLDRPFADLPALVAALPLSPLPASLVRPATAAYLARPVGNGPFRLAAPARPGRPLTLDRNPAWSGAPALLDKVTVRVVPDEQTAWLELQNGRVAFAPVPPDQLAAARTVHGPSPDGRTRPGLLQGPTLTTWSLTFNLRSNPARDLRWRQAVSLAIDRARLATALAGSPATTLVPPPTPGWTATGGAGSGTGVDTPCPACTHNPARARSLLAKAKATAGTAPVTLAIPPDGDARRLAGLVADDLAAAGVEVEVRTSPGGEGRGAEGLEGEAPLTLVRQVAPYPRPDPFLSTPASASPEGRRLLDRSRATPDDGTRTTHYHQAEAATLADLPATPLLTEHHAAVLAPTPQGVNLTPWGTLDLSTVSLPA
jgi:oligopeptide transport system substrate-binding protein